MTEVINADHIIGHTHHYFSIFNHKHDRIRNPLVYLLWAANNEFKIMVRTKLNLCKYCSFGHIKKDEHRINKRGKFQSFKCLECERKFTTNFGFEKTRVEPSTITGAGNT